MFPVHGASSPPLALPDMRGSTQPASPACSNANNSRNKQSRWPWLKAGGRLIGTGSALPGPAQAVARGAGVVGVAYASLWLLLLGYRTVKKQLLRKALREIVPALEKVGLGYMRCGGGGEEKAAACCKASLCALRSGCARVQPYIRFNGLLRD